MVGVRGGWAIAVVVAAGAVILPLLAPTTYWQGLVVLAAVFALLGLSVNLPSGYLGYLSFGHAAFFGLGGYAAALLTIKFGVDYWIATFVAAVPGIALGALVGFASLRVGGAYFAITSLTVAEILRLVADNWVDLTRGPMGLILPRPTIPVLADLGISFPQYYLAITIPVVGGCFLLVRLLLHSPEGRAWIAIRESVDLAESVGIATVRHRVINLAISGGLAAIAGALLIPKILVISPQLFSPLYSATGLLIVLLGGKGTLVGPLIGGTLFAVLPEAFRFVDEYRVAIFALLLLVIVRVRPDGLAPLLTKFVPTPYEGEEAAAATIPDAPGPRAGEAASGPLLEVVGLEKRFSGVVAVDALEFSVGRGEIVGLMGPNGAGKTTCLSMLSGFLAPSAGSVRFDGGQISGLSPHAIARRGMVRTFQHTTLFLGRPVLENVLIAAGGSRPSSLAASLLRTAAFARAEKERYAAARRALSHVGLADRADVMAGSLSYGEQRLLSVALAIVADPLLLLLDEPAAGLNPAEADRLAEMLSKLRVEGISILLVEHNVPMLMSLCDRLVVLHHGVKIAEGTPKQITEHPDVQRAYLGGGND
jgi:branched-chain amino acid transport system permease protein